MWAWFCAAPAAPAADLKDELDCGANPKLYDTHFARYGYLPLKSILREKNSLKDVRISLRPTGSKAIEQTGMYAYFAVAGDFEVSATYEVISIPRPQKGYGAQCGIAVDCERTGDTLSLSWVDKPGKGVGYLVTRGWKAEGPPDYKDITHVPTSAKKGRLIIRRERAELICLAADGSAEPRELTRVDFTDTTMRPLRLYAEPGQSPTVVDARIGNVVVRAEEITGGVPKREEEGGIGWWIVLGAVLVVGLGLLVYFRKPEALWGAAEK